MLELLMRHTADGCTYLQAIILVVLLIITSLSIPYMIYQDVKKSSQAAGTAKQGRRITIEPNIPQKVGKVKGGSIWR